MAQGEGQYLPKPPDVLQRSPSPPCPGEHTGELSSLPELTSSAHFPPKGKAGPTAERPLGLVSPLSPFLAQEGAGLAPGKGAPGPPRPSFRPQVSVPALANLTNPELPRQPWGCARSRGSWRAHLESPAALTEGLYELMERLVTSQNFQKHFESASLEMFAFKSLSFSVLGNKMCPSREMKLL